ncbi:unnamed protein product [Lupinus luteus]|uniref:Uncharacterized protein n=1 Tax=Lupinus luteus TaxID=3873 RepID=A0AAV1WYP9_LUPLU
MRLESVSSEALPENITAWISDSLEKEWRSEVGDEVRGGGSRENVEREGEYEFNEGGGNFEVGVIDNINNEELSPIIVPPTFVPPTLDVGIVNVGPLPVGERVESLHGELEKSPLNFSLMNEGVGHRVQLGFPSHVRI